MSMPVVDYLIMLTRMEQVAHCGWHHSLAGIDPSMGRSLSSGYKSCQAGAGQGILGS